MSEEELILRHGCNPHQVPAKIYTRARDFPIRVLNGSPGYINFLDALNSWQLVRELRETLELPAAASFKHVSPAGVGIGISLSDTLQKSYLVDDPELSPLASAYARARGADRMSSFGDWIALSDTVDVSTARVIYREVSDGVIAPGYEEKALSLLKKKRKGKYVILQIDPDYEPEEREVRQVFGIILEQKRNSLAMGPELLNNVVTQKCEIPDSGKRDLLLALIALKYTQSNSVCFALDGQVIGMGAGQQSRVHCTRLAAAKAERWYLRQHPVVLNFQFKREVKRPGRDNAIEQYLQGEIFSKKRGNSSDVFEKMPPTLTPEEKRDWLRSLKSVSFASDGFIPFRDSIDLVQESGVEYVVQPGGSLRDKDVINACNEFGMVMVLSGVRLFHH